MTAIWLNGSIVEEEQARLMPSERGFTLADGIFETVRAIGTQPLWWPDHLARLKRGAACFGIKLPYSDRIIEDALFKLLVTTGYHESAVRMTLSRGPTAQRGLLPPSDAVKPTFLITVAPTTLIQAPRTVIIARSTRRNEHSPLSRIKSLNYGDNLIAHREAIERGAGDALLLNGCGNLACATAGNVFLRLDGCWVTPPPSDGVLAGIARRRLISILKAREETIPAASLTRTDAVLVSNSLGCSSVVQIDGRELAPAGDEFDFGALYAD